MARIREFSETSVIKTTHECDVLVAGGGVAGIAAALSAARAGARVLLVEREFLLGGLATLGLVTIYLPLCDGMGHQVSFGLAEELLRLSIKHGAEARYPEIWLDRDATPEERAAEKRFEVRCNPQLFALDAEALLLSEGVEILYGTLISGVRKEDGKITHVVIENKSGRSAVEVKSVVDTTGDADVCHLAGAKCALNEPGDRLAAWYYYFMDGEYKLKSLGFCDSPEEQKEPEKSNKIVSRRYNGVDGDEVSKFTQKSHEELFKSYLNITKDAKVAFPVTLATIPQFRMTRKLVGKYTLDESEVHTYQEDSIGLVSDWRKRGPVFEIPFGTLFGGEVKNLITAGRCISVTDAMWDITRVIPDCAVTGEAAGAAAALSSDFATLEVKKLQELLRARGVKIHEKEAYDA